MNGISPPRASRAANTDGGRWRYPEPTTPAMVARRAERGEQRAFFITKMKYRMITGDEEMKILRHQPCWQARPALAH